MKQILALSHAWKSYDGKVVLNDVALGFLPGAKIGVVGPNGMGKSTLLRLMAGLEQPSNGEVVFLPGYTRGILAQEPALDEGKTVLGNVEDGVAAARALLDYYDEVAAKLAADYSDDLLDEMGRLQEQLDHAEAWDLDARLEQAMDALRCPPPDADVTVLSGGERRRVALCRLLLSQPDLLLLDEPTNHLDAESTQWLEQHLARYPGTVVAVTHDRYFLDNVAGWILELDRGHAYPYEGNYTTYLETKAARMKVEGQRDAKLRRRLEDELECGRVNLALSLKQGGNLLLLDEPANDLDVETLASLENALGEFPGCAVITSHHRWFLDRVATHILACEGGADWFWFEGNFAAYKQNKNDRLGDEAARPHRVTYRKLTR
jgi:ATPase subunit of ABC transporter with duplicated ATPase domains